MSHHGPVTHLLLSRGEACPRRSLATLIASGASSHAALSRMLGRPRGYLARFINDGVPRALRPDEHHRLATFFGVGDRALGIRDLWSAR
jgi:hypothetical protein